MLKLICDKCKKEIGADEKKRFYITIDNASGECEHCFDLCEECVDKLVNFITDYEITKADEYKKGYDDGLKEGKEEAWMDSMGDDL